MAMKKRTARRPMRKRKSRARRKPAKRELIDTHQQTVRAAQRARHVLQQGRDAGKPVTQDKRTKAKRKVPPAQGDRGDRAQRAVGRKR